MIVFVAGGVVVIVVVITLMFVHRNVVMSFHHLRTQLDSHSERERESERVFAHAHTWVSTLFIYMYRKVWKLICCFWNGVFRFDEQEKESNKNKQALNV